MARSVSDVIDSILAKKIDKQEALRSFESLSDEEKNQLIADLKFKLPGNDTSMDDAEGVGNDSASVRLLKSIHEMNLTEHHGQYIAALSQASMFRNPRRMPLSTRSTSLINEKRQA